MAVSSIHPFHLPMYPINGEFDSDTHLNSTYSVESDPSEPTYPSVFQLTSDSSLVASITLFVYSSSFIILWHAWVVETYYVFSFGIWTSVRYGCFVGPKIVYWSLGYLCGTYLYILYVYV